MFLPFFDNLRSAGIPVSLREYLTFLEALSKGLVIYDIEGFYYLARSAMVKDERLIDRFDRAFAASFEGLEQISAAQVMQAVDLPAESLEKMAEKHLSSEAKVAVEAVDVPAEVVAGVGAESALRLDFGDVELPARPVSAGELHEKIADTLADDDDMLGGFREGPSPAAVLNAPRAFHEDRFVEAVVVAVLKQVEDAFPLA